MRRTMHSPLDRHELDVGVEAGLGGELGHERVADARADHAHDGEVVVGAEDGRAASRPRPPTRA